MNSSRDGAPESEACGLREIGPNPFFVVGAILASPLFWAGVALTAFRFSETFQLIILKGAHLRPVQERIVDFYVWMKELPVPLWFGLLVASVAVALVRYGTSSYRLSPNRDLIVNTGLLGWTTPRGPLIAYADTIAGRLISDVNVSRNLLQLVVGTGTLHVTFAEYPGNRATARTIHLPFVDSPYAQADLLMSGAGVNDVRYFL